MHFTYNNNYLIILKKYYYLLQYIYSIYHYKKHYNTPPTFPKIKYNFNISKNQPPKTIINQIKTKNKNSNSLNYQLKTNNIYYFFSI